MNIRIKVRWSFLLSILIAACTHSLQARDAILVEGGEFTPLYGMNEPIGSTSVKAFRMDRYPVSNGQYYKFVRLNPHWAPERAPSILTDEKYLKHWENVAGKERRPKRGDRERPVTQISWFAAMDYCASQGGRLPTVLEWEYAAAASDKVRDATHDPEFIQRLLNWYSKPTGGTDNLSLVGQSTPNVWGIYDLHGLVWEWTSDFNSVFVVGDNRRDGESLADLFCGAGAAAGGDKANYAAFMRYALRNSLKGSYTTSNLGFRCVYDFTGNL